MKRSLPSQTKEEAARIKLIMGMSCAVCALHGDVSVRVLECHHIGSRPSERSMATNPTTDELNRRYDPMNRDELIAECEKLRKENALLRLELNELWIETNAAKTINR